MMMMMMMMMMVMIDAAFESQDVRNRTRAACLSFSAPTIVCS
jgi:hypothetical protein